MSSSSFDLPSGPFPVHLWLTPGLPVDCRLLFFTILALLSFRLLPRQSHTLLSCGACEKSRLLDSGPVLVIRINFRFRSSARLVIFILAQDITPFHIGVKWRSRNYGTSSGAQFPMKMTSLAELRNRKLIRITRTGPESRSRLFSQAPQLRRVCDCLGRSRNERRARMVKKSNRQSTGSPGVNQRWTGNGPEGRSNEEEDIRGY
ncbi:hypothetical protein B0H10DRAFT_2195774 [Mycena sp. CBHHK59/15]|nr:hypothetical protein B0H10DRAFT_2195774 [Mycena sp. CBHHK59/15]